MLRNQTRTVLGAAVYECIGQFSITWGKITGYRLGNESSDIDKRLSHVR